MATQSYVTFKVNGINAFYYTGQVQGGGVTPLLLNNYPASAAYSLRKIKSDYTGNVIRVRRSNDNSELNIGFDQNGILDTESLLNFVGYTNLFVGGSEALSTNAGFSATGITITGNWLTGPDGVTPGNKITENGVNNYHYSSYSIISGTPDTHNYSAYLKKGTGSNAPDRIAIAIGNATYNMSAIFNLTTGTIDSQFQGTATSYQVTMTDAGNGWYRCSVGGKLNYSTTQNIRISIQFVNNNASYNPFTGGAYVGNINSDVQVTQLQWIKEANVQRYGKTLTSGGGAPGNGFVTTWYDQSGNGYTRTSPTAANQPSIVINGVLNTANGKVALYFDGTNDQFLQQSPTFGDNTVGAGLNSTVFSVTKLDPTYLTNNEHPIFGGLANNAIRFSVLNNKWYLINTTGTGISSTENVTTNQVISSVLFAPIDKVRINNSEVISGNVGTGGTDSYIGRSWLGKFYKGFIQEHIIYLTDQTSNFTTIESDINSHYGAY